MRENIDITSLSNSCSHSHSHLQSQSQTHSHSQRRRIAPNTSTTTVVGTVTQVAPITRPSPSCSTSELGGSKDRVKSTLNQMSRQNRASFLRSLSQSLGLSDAHYLMELLRARLVVDPLGELPVEVQLRVLEWMENPVDLLKMARTCREWNRIALDTTLWVRLLRHRLKLTRMARRIIEKALSESIDMNNQQNTATVTTTATTRKHHNHLPVQICWLALKYETLLKRNWQTASFTATTAAIGAHGSSVITSLNLDEHEGVLLSAADNGTIGVWPLHDYNHDEEHITGPFNINRRILVGHQGGVWALASRRNLLITGSTDRSLIAWDWKRGSRLVDLVGHTSTVRCAEIVGNWVVSGSRDGTVRVWNVEDLIINHDNDNDYDYDYDYDYINGHHNTNRQIRNPRLGERCLYILTGHRGSVRCMAAWGNHHLVTGSYDGTLRVWNLRQGKCVAICAGHDGKVYSVATTRNYIFSGGIDGKIRVWNPLTGEPLEVFSDHTALVGLLSVNPRGDRLVAASTDGSLSLWDTKTLNRLRHIELAHRASITALGINNQVVISGAEYSLKLWPLSELTANTVDDPVEPILLADKMETIWKVEVGEAYAVVAYQQAGESCLGLYNFQPDTSLGTK